MIDFNKENPCRVTVFTCSNEFVEWQERIVAQILQVTSVPVIIDSRVKWYVSVVYILGEADAES